MFPKSQKGCSVCLRVCVHVLSLSFLICFVFLLLFYGPIVFSFLQQFSSSSNGMSTILVHVLILDPVPVLPLAGYCVPLGASQLFFACSPGIMLEPEVAASLQMVVNVAALSTGGRRHIGQGRTSKGVKSLF